MFRAVLSFAILAILSVGMVLTTPRSADAQLLDRIRDAAEHEAEAETERQVRKAVRSGIRCVVGDRECLDRARREGRDVVLVDEQGNPVEATPADGAPAAAAPATDAAAWSLAVGDRSWEGDAGQVIDDPAMLALHLTDRSDVALYLFLANDDEGQRGAAAVVLATDDESCLYPYPGSTPFVVRLDEVGSDQVAGAYQGMVGCDGGAAPVRASGTFRVAR